MVLNPNHKSAQGLTRNIGPAALLPDLPYLMIITITTVTSSNNKNNSNNDDSRNDNASKDKSIIDKISNDRTSNGNSSNSHIEERKTKKDNPAVPLAIGEILCRKISARRVRRHAIHSCGPST
jgi:hypothetical protein